MLDMSIEIKKNRENIGKGEEWKEEMKSE